MSQQFGRRRFLEQCGGGALGLLAAGYAGTARGYLANETISVGCIGTGGRCRWLMQRLAKIPGVKIAAVCDVWDDNLQQGRKLADPSAATFTDYHELLARQDIDAVLIGAPDDADGTATLLRRLRGVMVARRYVLIDYDLPVALIDEAVALAPGIESPTISPLRDPEWVAVRVMTPRNSANQVMDALYALGARAILVTAIHNARL